MGTCVYGWQIEAVYLIAGLLISSLAWGTFKKLPASKPKNIMNPDRKSMFPTAVLIIFRGLTNESQNIEILSTNSAYVAEVQLPKKCKVLFLNSGTHASKTKCKEFMVCRCALTSMSATRTEPTSGVDRTFLAHVFKKVSRSWNQGSKAISAIIAPGRLKGCRCSSGTTS